MRIFCAQFLVAIAVSTSLAATSQITIAPSVQITVPTEPDLHYEVQASPTLENPTWTSVDITRHGYGLPLHFTAPINPFTPSFILESSEQVDTGYAPASKYPLGRTDSAVETARILPPAQGAVARMKDLRS